MLGICDMPVMDPALGGVPPHFSADALRERLKSLLYSLARIEIPFPIRKGFMMLILTVIREEVEHV
jgi:hypothetical protein